jgi:inward rectifier potassium channel
MAESPPEDDFVLLGVPRTPFYDLYHVYIRSPMVVSIGMIVLAFLAVNVLFAFAYLGTGGVAHVRPGSLADAFFFSVQTMGTIGYGQMYPETPAAHTLVTVEAVVGMLWTAVSTGLVFAKISQPQSRIAFSKKVAVSNMNGVQTMAFRVGNQRGNIVHEAQIHVVLTRTEVTAEGVTMYRIYDLQLVRDRAPALTRTWTVLHQITEASPLWGANAAKLQEWEAEIGVSVGGTDDTTMQPVHGRRRYLADEVVFDHRLADVLRVLPNGKIEVDLRKFDDIVPVSAP